MTADATSMGAPAGFIEVPASQHSFTPRQFRFPREGKIWLLSSIVMFVTGLLKGINLLVLLAYLLIGLWVFNAVILRGHVRRLAGKRNPVGPIFAGSPVNCSVVIESTGTRSLRGIMLIDRGIEHSRAWLLLDLPPGAPVVIRHTEVFNNRGRYSLQPLQVYSSFPFGLVTLGVDLTGPDEWIILPRLGRVHIEPMKHWLAKCSRSDGRSRRRQLVSTAHEADFHGLREFRSGDSPRWIHWRSSARRNQLMVREFEDSTQTHLILVVEPWIQDPAAQPDHQALESLISLASTIVWEWCRDMTARLSLVLAGELPRVIGNGTGSDFALHLLGALAVESGSPPNENLSWFQDSRPQWGSGAFLVLTSNPRSSLAESLSDELGRPVAKLDMTELPPWYEAPETGKPT